MPYYPVTCRGCGKVYRKHDSNLVNWRGYCMACYCHGSQRMIEVECKTCGKRYLKDRFSVVRWLGECQPCARPPRRTERHHLIACPDCGATRKVRDDHIRAGAIRCKPCGIKAAMTPERRAGIAERSRRWAIENNWSPKPTCESRRRGTAHHNWKGGISNELAMLRCTPEFKRWAKAVKVRDDFTCRHCGIRGGKLHSHHIHSFAQFPDIRFELWNGITLCGSCHARQHYREGTGSPLKYRPSN